MTKYEEMQNAAMSNRVAWIQQNERVFIYFQDFVSGLIKYCGIPDGRITLLRKVEGEEQYTEAPDGKRYMLPSAIEFSEEDGFWHLGIAITLSEPGVFPQFYFSFLLKMKEDSSDVLIRTGLEQKVWRIPRNQVETCEQLFESIARMSIQSLTDRRTPGPNGIGFLNGA